ncbi:MAG: methyltransferase domain-containing protein [Candidatus Competibacteraceae bacterium]|nr:methyltransferase domain-containing protein [Candidatus Competibacteraceae bacterium]
MVEQRYIHGFSKQEQDRLLKQGEFVEPYVYEKIDFSHCHRILEIGCGVGAQIAVLARRFPRLIIHGMDKEESQINRAKQVLKDYVDNKRVSLNLANAEALPFPDNYYDGACIFFVLEHVANPLALLKEAHRVLKPKGVLYCTEVFNSGFYIHPHCPAISDYWQAFNQYQIDLGGDPDIGIKLVNLGLQAGFKEITDHPIAPLLDGRMKKITKRREFLNYWKSLFLSASERLIDEKRITSAIVSELQKEFAALSNARDAIFLYSGRQIRCFK